MSIFNHKIVIKYFRRKKYGKLNPFEELTKDEKKILEDISIGKSYQTIAEELNISKEEVQKIIRDIYAKLQDNYFNNENN